MCLSVEAGIDVGGCCDTLSFRPRACSSGDKPVEMTSFT